ncbi:MAG: hypothetical protein E6J39_04225 [Chloroflexi bacterium]|nr:MAG: hypothetical protein E6J39_04225 [Chloroflexota bacterium]
MVSVVVSLDVDEELFEELAPLADGVGVDTLAATAWLPGLLTAATQPKPSVAPMPARVTPMVVDLSR